MLSQEYSRLILKSSISSGDTIYAVIKIAVRVRVPHGNETGIQQLPKSPAGRRRFTRRKIHTLLSHADDNRIIEKKYRKME